MACGVRGWPLRAGRLCASARGFRPGCPRPPQGRTGSSVAASHRQRPCQDAAAGFATFR